MPLSNILARYGAPLARYGAPPARYGAPLATLALGAAGGMGFHLLGLPAAFLSGSMLSVAIAAVAGCKVGVPDGWRNVAFFAIAAILGSTVRPETVASLPSWPASLAILAVCIAALMLAIPAYLRTVHGFDRNTALLSAVPGALSYVVALAEDLGADTRRVAVVQTARLAILLLVIPLVVGTVMEVRAPAAGAGDTLAWPLVALVLLACAPVVPLARRAGVPAPFFTAPMLVSALIFGSATLEGRMPEAMLMPALVVVGAAIGARFAGSTRTFLRQNLLAGLGATGIGLAISGLLAWLAADLLSLPFVQLWLALAPGGFEAMTVLAFSLGVDPAFVAGHQLLRFLGLSIALPIVFRRARRRPQGRRRRVQ